MRDLEKTIGYKIGGSDRGHQTQIRNGFHFPEYSYHAYTSFCAPFALNGGVA